MAALDRKGIARVLREISVLLQIKGENPFKTRAYEVAAQRIEDLPADELETRAAAGTLIELPGIGEAIAKKVDTLWRTGSLPLHEQLRAEVPPGLLDLMRVPDLGPKKIAALNQGLGIGSLEDLAKACREGKVRELRGFGAKTETKLMQAIAAMGKVEGRRPLASVRPVAEELVERLRRLPQVSRAEIGGSVRRYRETVADLDLLVAAPEAGPIFDEVCAWPAVQSVLGRGDTKCSITLRDGLQVDVRVLPNDRFATALHHFTGSRAHHMRLRSLARQKGLTISEWGVERLEQPGVPLPIATEAELYQALGMAYVSPEMREDTGEVEAAQAGALPTPIELQDVRGYVHMHTTDSDGRNDLLSMARAVAELGGKYLTVTDHSPSSGYAGGLSRERLEKQWEEIARVQEQVPAVRLLRGVEADILEDGRLDHPDEVLEKLDVVIASIHTRFQMDEAQMTRRILKALDNPFAQILAHPSGRLIGKRDPYPMNLEAILVKAAEVGTAVEVNGNPERLDLNGEQVRRALALGVKLVASTDAHSVNELRHLHFSVGTLRRGWARREDVLNCLDAEGFLAALRRS